MTDDSTGPESAINQVRDKSIVRDKYGMTTRKCIYMMQCTGNTEKVSESVRCIHDQSTLLMSSGSRMPSSPFMVGRGSTPLFTSISAFGPSFNSNV